MPYKTRESAIAAARKLAAKLDREPNADPETLYAIATKMRAITAQTTPAGWHAHPWHSVADDIERERAALYRKAGDVLHQKDVQALALRVHPALRRPTPVEPWAKPERPSDSS